MHKLAIGLALLLFLVPVPFQGADPGKAILYGQGHTFVNGAEVMHSSVLFSGDEIETDPYASASIVTGGLSVFVAPATVASFGEKALQLDRGAVSVSTWTGRALRTGGLTIAPASENTRADFNVSHVNGKIHIQADRGSITVADAQGEIERLTAGQSTDRLDENRAGEGGGPVPAASGGVLGSWVGIAAGGAVIAGVAGWVFSQNQQPMSPANP